MEDLCPMSPAGLAGGHMTAEPLFLQGPVTIHEKLKLHFVSKF